MDKDDDAPFDAWDDEPDWAREGGVDGDEADGTDDEDENDVQKRNVDPNGEERRFGAQHVLILIDCNPSMFVPCVAVSDEDEEDEEGDGDDVDDDCGAGDDDGVGGNDGGRKKTTSGRRKKLVSPFDAALMAVESLLKTRIRYVATSKSGKRDGVGVLLYGTRRRSEDDGPRRLPSASSSSGSTTTHELIPLSPPGVEQVLGLRDCLPPAEVGSGGGGRGEIRSGSGGKERERDLREEFEDVDGDRYEASDAAARMGNASLCPLRSAFHEANRAFRNAKCVKEATASTPGDSKTLWIFTNEDDPCRVGGGGDDTRRNEEERKHLIVAARDATENGMDVHVWPLPKPPMHNSGNDGEASANAAAGGGGDAMGSSFNRDLFYNHVTTRDDQVDQASSSPTTMSLDDFLSRVGRQWKRVRRALCLPLLFPGCDDFKSEGDDAIMLDFYRIVQNQSRPKPVQVHQETNKTTVQTSQMLAVDSGEIIEKKQQKARMRRFLNFGGERIPFTQDELLEMKKQSHANREFPSLIVLGFKPTSSIPIFHNLDKSYFVYPNEDEAAGSRAAFSALHAAMIRKGVLGIGELVTRATFVSRLVAIVPQEEVRLEYDDVGGGGLDEQVAPPGWVVYTLPYEDDVRAVDTSDGSCVIPDEKTVNAARELIRNQQIQGIEWDIQFENPALKRFWDYIESVALGVPLPEDTTDDTKMDVEAIVTSAGEQIAAFREGLPPEDEERNNGKKRKAPTKISSVDSHGDWLKMSKSGTLEDCTVDLLKSYLRSAGLKLGGKKDQLIQRVKEHLEAENQQSESVQEKV